MRRKHKKTQSVKMLDIQFTLVWKRFLRALGLFIKYTTFRKFFNLVCVETERKLQRSCVKGWPYFIKLQASGECDAGCRYCLLQEKKVPRGNMELDTFKKIIDETKAYVYLIALHYYGEPLMNKDIYKMIKYAHVNRIATYMSTNLQHFKKKDAAELILSGLDLLTISLDGASDQTYKQYRQKGDFNVILDNIDVLVKEKRKLKRKYPEINIQFIVMKHNEHEVVKIKEIAGKLQVDSLEFKPLGTFDKSLLPNNPLYLRKIYKYKDLKRQPCWWLWAAMVILYDGSVCPCCMVDPKESAGNLQNESWRIVKNSLLYRKLRSGVFSPDDPVYRRICRDCKIPYGGFISQSI